MSVKEDINKIFEEQLNPKDLLKPVKGKKPDFETSLARLFKPFMDAVFLLADEIDKLKSE